MRVRPTVCLRITVPECLPCTTPGNRQTSLLPSAVAGFAAGVSLYCGFLAYLIITPEGAKRLAASVSRNVSRFSLRGDGDTSRASLADGQQDGGSGDDGGAAAPQSAEPGQQQQGRQDSEGAAAGPPHKLPSRLPSPFAS